MLIGLALVTVYNVRWNSTAPADGSQRENAVRSAMRARSVQSLQAVNLAEQTRGTFFPLFDMRRQELALDAYRHVIELDAGLHHGYAGAAQVLATIVHVTPANEATAGILEEARQLASKALELGPESAWSHGAYAWVLAVSGNTRDSISHARLAVDLDPEDGHVLDLAGISGRCR